MSKRSQQREEVARLHVQPALQPLTSQETITQTFSQHSGPIPSPETLKGYESVLAGSADRIISMAENQALHRQELEKLSVEATIADAMSERREARMGQLFGLVIGVAGIAASAAIVILVPSAPGASVASIIGGTTVLGLVTTLIIGQRAARQESAEIAKTPPNDDAHSRKKETGDAR